MKQKGWLLALGIILACISVIGVCGGAAILYIYFDNVNFAKGVKELEPLMINASDLPNGWESAQYSYSLPGGYGATAGRNDVFQILGTSSSSFVYLSHEVFLYPSEQDAATGYQDLLTRDLPTALPSKPVDFTFTPKNTTDKFDKYCTDGNGPNDPNSHFCIFIQQHGRYVTELRAMFDNNKLTAAQVNDVLQKLDSKLP